MSREERSLVDLGALFRRLAADEDELSVREKLAMLDAARTRSPELAARLDQLLLAEVTRLHAGLREAKVKQEKLEQVFEKLTAPALHPALYLQAVDSAGGPRALVAYGDARRVVGFAEEVDPLGLQPGDEVLLGRELNVIVGMAQSRHVAGETAIFDRPASDGRIVLRSRDEEVVVQPLGGLRGAELRAGDLVRWDRSLWLAFEKVERASGSHLFLEDTPSESFADIGGLDEQIEELERTVLLHREQADLVRRYGLPRRSSVLLAGPPGTGKTLLARGFANWLATECPAGRARFMNIKPAGLHSMWYAQSEANYRETFRVAREAAARDPGVPVVMFFDEIDAIGSVRGESHTRVDDRVLTAFMTELDGLEARGDIVVIAATNRRAALDPALLRPGRLGDLVLDVPRPGRQAGAEILARHLKPDVPCAPGPDGAGTDRGALISAAVSRIYAPNGIGELATITFRDGRRHTVTATDLVSGAVLAGIARRALERACLRHVEGGEPGVRVDDLSRAAEQEFESLANGLTPGNCRAQLEALPQDVDIVAVEPVRRPARRTHRYLSVA